MRHQGGARRFLTAAVPVTAAAILAACGPHGRDARVATAEDGASRHADTPAAAYEVAIQQAEGAHRVAEERCDAMTGDARASCHERADADLERARTRARQVRDTGIARGTS